MPPSYVAMGPTSYPLLPPPPSPRRKIPSSLIPLPPIPSPSLVGSLSLPFSPENNIILYGDAYFRGAYISLTQEVPCPSSPSSLSSSMGRALYMSPVRFLDPKTNATASFSCRFSFVIIPNPMCQFGDGIAFLIVPDADSFSLNNGFMGLPETNLKTQESFIAVEFDTNYDPSLGDINGNHIGIDVNTISSFASVDVVSQFNEYMHVGFSASSDKGSAMHIIEHWRFKTFRSRKCRID